MTYSVNHANQLRHAAIFVDKLLKGAKPADLPIEQPTEFYRFWADRDFGDRPG